VYTSWLITESLPILQPDNTAIATRLMKNPVDIGNLLDPVIGREEASSVRDLFTEHLELAAGALEPVRNNTTNLVNIAVHKLYSQGDRVGEALHNLNPNKLIKDYAIDMMRQHNEFVVKLAQLRANNEYVEYIETFDEYYKHMLMFSDMIYEALMP
jgi:hypothetical protein